MMKEKRSKSIACLILALLLLLPGVARADFSRFDRAPRKGLIFEARTEASVSLLYGDSRYMPGAVGVVYADVSKDAGREIPLIAVYFMHASRAKNPMLTVTTDRKIYKVTQESNFNKTGITPHPNAFHIAAGPDTAAMLKDMGASKSVKVVCGSKEDSYEILITKEKQALIRLAAEEYAAHVAAAQDKLESLEKKKYVERVAPLLETQDKPKPAKTVYTELNSRSTGEKVKKLQRYLFHYGYYKGTADGKYSKAVTAAVKKYQRKVHLSDTGKADERTQKKLYAKEIPWKPAVNLSGSRMTKENGVKKVCFAFKNPGCEFTVTGAQIVVRLLNASGKVITVGDAKLFSYTVGKMTLKPGKTRSSSADQVTLNGVSGVAAAEAGIVAYTVAGGKTVHVPTEKIEWKKIQ